MFRLFAAAKSGFLRAKEKSRNRAFVFFQAGKLVNIGHWFAKSWKDAEK